VTKQDKKRRKKTPLRTCVGCRTVLEKRELVRIVRTSEGVYVDLTGRINGRGAYLHRERSCWENGLEGSLAHALKTNITSDDKKRLESFFQTLPRESSDEILPETFG
jgi:predicted RNA-binding protein YlxR (DUF448 family)